MQQFVIIFVLFFLISCGGDPAPKVGAVANNNLEIGEQLFKVKCQQCHMADKDFAAPAIAGVSSRWTDQKLLYEFVRNSSAVIQRNQYAAQLFETWKQAPMLPFTELTDAEIQGIFDYCDKFAAEAKK
ncbi:MAG: cytochrome c [Ferruginibacter sp.]